MKKTVPQSAFSFTLTIALLALLCISFFMLYKNSHNFECMILGVAILLLSAAGLFYMPMSLTLNDGILSVNRSLWIKKIPLSQIDSVKMCPPTMGARRIIGSGGFMGYWGWFREGDIGKYFAYYNKASDCFLLTLKNGRKYMLGCKDAPEMVAAIQSGLGR